VCLAVASDGWDNTDVAGALVDDDLAQEVQAQDIDPQRFLDKNDSYMFFKKIGGQIITGRTGSNIADLYMTLTS